MKSMYYLHQKNKLYFSENTAFSVLLTEKFGDCLKFKNEQNALLFKKYLYSEFELELMIGKYIIEPGFYD